MMNCPNCGKPEKQQTIKCIHCGESHSNAELLELRQLEYLVQETSNWAVAQRWRRPYLDKLNAIKQKMASARRPPEPEPIVKAVPVAAAPSKPAPLPKPTPKPAPPKEKVPFDQWLLSERNIKFALYSGAVLLVLAGVIFVGINWGRIPGLGKFAITLLTSAIMYAGGYFLFHKPGFRLGGNALLAIASGFFALNFAVLQNYVLSPAGFPAERTWLIASPICMLLYAYTAVWTKESLFTYFTLAALGNTINSALIVGNARDAAYPLVYLVALLVVLVLAARLRATRHEAYSVRPVFMVVQILAPIGVLVASLIWIAGSSVDAWLAIASIAVGVAIYAATDWLFNQMIARWITAALGTWLVFMLTTQLDFSQAGIGVSMLLLSIAYLAIGYLIQSSKEETTKGGLPYFTLGYLVAILVTVKAVPVQADLAKILLTDVALLAVSAYIHRDYKWIYAAVWLFIMPYTLYADLADYNLKDIGILLGVLGLVYSAAGYYLGRRSLGLGAPFLSAAVFLNAVAVVMTWQDVFVVSIALLVNAALYAFAAWWQKRPHLLLASLVAISLMVIPITSHYADGFDRMLEASVISLIIMGVFFVVGGMLLRQSRARDWGWPLYLIGGINIFLAHSIGLQVLGNWMVVAFSFVIAVLSFTLAWFERNLFRKDARLPLLSYLAVGILFIGHFYLLDEVIGSERFGIWPLYTSVYLAVFVAASWLLRNRAAAPEYENPCRFSGSILMVVPLMMALFNASPETRIYVFAIAGLTYLLDAWINTEAVTAYAGSAAFAAAYLIGVGVWDHWMTVAMSLLAAAVVFLAGWLGWRKGSGLGRLPVLPYVAAAVLFHGHFALLAEVVPSDWNVYLPIFTAAFTTLLVVVSWLLPPSKLAQFYAVPVRQSGLILMIAPLWSSTFSSTLKVQSITFAAAGTTYLADAWRRRQSIVAFTSASAFIVAYIVGLEAWGNWVMVAISPLAAAVMYFLAWLVRRSTPKFVDLPLLQYVAIAMLYAGFWRLLQQVIGSRLDTVWPAYLAAFSLVMVAVNWLLQNRGSDPFFADPFRYSGLLSQVVFMYVSYANHPSDVTSITFAAAATTYAADAWVRKNVAMAYLSTGMYVGSLWSLLTNLHVTERQAFVIPLGMVLLALGWYERNRREGRYYLIFTTAGLLSLMATAFQQSLPDDGAGYALLLAVECLLAIGWGIRTHSRVYVQFGGIVLVANALVQYGPAFADLDRWIQLGSVGTILLSMGMLALGRRDQVLNTRKRLTEEWRGWNS